MQRTGTRLGVAIAALCLLVALAFGGMAAFAAASWHGDAYDNSLTVEAVSPSDGMAADLATADVVVDVYRVAAATKDASYDTYNYTWEAPFGTSGDAVPATWFDVSASSWDERAAAAAALLAGAGEVQSESVAAGEALEGLDAGLYLVLAHGAAADEAVTFDASGAPMLVAHSDLYEYTFKPSLVAVPGKAVAEDGTIGTAADYGPWLSDVTVQLKPERTPNYGSLRIVKNVSGVEGSVDPATFVFHIAGTTPDGAAYDNYASVYYTGGTQVETLVTHIPAGTVVTVTEDYMGARYRLVSSDGASKTIVADRAVAAGDADYAFATFTNEPDNTTEQGHGIENHFELQESDGDWHWTAVPSTDVVEGQ